jgi:UDP-N-acetylglucosamine transferase subunit ALG13
MAAVGAAGWSPVLGGGLLILVSVGSMMAFDRLIRAMDEWARQHADERVFAQIGAGPYEPKSMRHARMLSPSKFREVLTQCSLLVAHAGMGSFFTAMEMGKPVVLLPRRASHKEHTTDHQLHTVKWLREKPGVYVAMSEDGLAEAIDKALKEQNHAIHDFSRFAPEPLLSKIRSFLVS